MRYHAILFDLDGTLLNTLRDLADAANHALTAQGFPAHPVDAYRYFVGEGAQNLVTRALPEAARTEAAIQRALALFRDAYAQNWNAHTRPYPGVPELLAALRARRLPLAVLSNKPNDFTQQCVHALLPDGEFACVFGQREGRPRKPDPSGALEIAATLGVTPADVLYVGDSGIDMQAARAAGMFPVGALWGFRDKAELLANGAQALIARPEELLGLLA